ncbi:WW domain [Dillenia turbinata]|uniref:WW domain n=1 Tax=Dillenia turbinata TaxID=194707 RepID=A0AAN8VGH9_9MAGN
MGKRKERRLAAQSNAGRRVKLDLFAEPSGELGGLSASEDIGGDIDPKQCSGLLKSPTSSGRLPENPLLLLGQYSDEELDEESNKGLGTTVSDSQLPDPLVVVEENSGKEHGVAESNVEAGIGAERVKEEGIEQDSTTEDIVHYPEDNDDGGADATLSSDLQQESKSMEHFSVPGTYNTQTTAEFSSSWKMVMHEESNQYYYWNTETGETSWEVPAVSAQIAETNYEQTALNPIISPTSGSASGLVDTSTKHSDDGNIGTVPSSKGICYQNNLAEEPAKIGGHDVNQTELKNTADLVAEFYHEISSLENCLPYAPSSDGSLANAGSKKCTDISLAEEQPGIELSQLVKYGECLLERLKSLKESKGPVQGHDSILKYILELEIRLSDIRSLSSFGSSLLPFWMHSEMQLKKLECAINDESIKLSQSGRNNEVEAAEFSSIVVNNKAQESMMPDSEGDKDVNRTKFSTSECSHSSSCTETSTSIKKDSPVEAPIIGVTGISSHGNPTSFLPEVNHDNDDGDQVTDEQTSPQGPDSPEDVDMEVDMEVEVTTPSRSTASEEHAKYSVPVVLPICTHPHAENPSLAMEEGLIIPPPPDDEWIPPPPPDNEMVPPPPPDNELVPPPPPDDPPQSSYPLQSSYTEIMRPLGYTEQYNLSYPHYYEPTISEVSNSHFYGQTEGCQVAVPQPYYAVPIAYSNTSSILVVYYNYQDETAPAIPVVCSTESSVFDATSLQIGSVDAVAVADSSSSINLKTEAHAFCDDTGKAPFSNSATVLAPATASVIESVPVPSTTTATVPAVVSSASASGTAAMSQPKALRNKKRTAVASTLRSNKIVSSLVDKWKAAKEELHEDEEEEPENAYEILERKRQREIKEWRAQQIASGEAKDNANFQPLGGDWRERVKRRRAQKISKSVESPEQPPDGNEQPDLVELSKDLPSGWQAYWDESSKQIYYGNTITSETTWTKPTQ